MQRSKLLIALFVLLPAAAFAQPSSESGAPEPIRVENTINEKTVELAPMVQGEQLAKDGEEDR